MPTTHIIRCALLCLTAGAIAVSVQERAEALDPDQVWQEIITAKGGSDRLNSIRSFAISLDTVTPPGWGRADVIDKGHHEFVVVLPDRVWRASDYRPGKMGFSVDVWDRSRRTFWGAWDGNPPTRSNWNEEYDWDTATFVEQLSLTYFCRIPGFSPRPISTRVISGRIHLEMTSDTFARIVYRLQAERALPDEITLTPKVRGAGGGLVPATFSYRYQISAYEEVEGLLLPKTFPDYGSVTIILNPALEPALFGKPQDGLLDASTWRQFLKK